MSTSYELSGKIKVIGQSQSFGAKGFTKREFVVTVEDGKYPQDINLEFVQDKCYVLDSFDVGDGVSVSFNLRGKESKGRYFNELQAWRCVKTSNQSSQPEQQPRNARKTDSFHSGELPADSDDDDSIPF